MYVEKKKHREKLTKHGHIENCVVGKTYNGRITETDATDFRNIESELRQFSSRFILKNVQFTTQIRTHSSGHITQF